MVCVNGCCGQGFSLWRILCQPLHYFTQCHTTPPLTSHTPNIHLQPSSLCTSYEHNSEENNQMNTQFCTSWQQFWPKNTLEKHQCLSQHEPTWSHFPSRLGSCGNMNTFCARITGNRWAFLKLHRLWAPFLRKKQISAQFAPTVSTKWTQLLQMSGAEMNTIFAPARSTILKKQHQTETPLSRQKKYPTSTKLAPTRIHSKRSRFWTVFLWPQLWLQISFSHILQCILSILLIVVPQQHL